ncbi:MAG: dual specificity protein phosphatase family protein [Anaerolineae bacterium]|nr:dual specificity protein phosphatase family protein [Anaerolineae bacterium]
MGNPVVSMCGAGMSRSVTFVMAYLRETGLDLRPSWELVAAQHSDAQPAPQM